MRFLRRTMTAGALGALAGLGISFAPAVAQTPLAIERDPPLATRPVAPAPILVPQTSGVPVPANPPAPVAPIVVPPGPAPVVVPAPSKPDAVFVPKTPEIQPSTGHAVAPKPAEAPVEKAAPSEPAPSPAPTPAPAPEAAPAAAPSAAPAAGAPPAPPSSPAPETPTPAAPAPSPVTPAPTAPAPAAPAPAAPAPTAPAPSEAAPPPRASTAPAVEEVTVAPRDVLFVTGVTTWEKAEDQVGEAFGRLAQAAEKLRVEKTGGPLVEYIESDSDDVGFRAMVPIAAAPKGKPPKGVKVGRSPNGPALKFHHDGPIDDLEEVYARIDDEVTKRGVDARSIVEEYDGDALASPEDRVVVDVWVFLK